MKLLELPENKVEEALKCMTDKDLINMQADLMSTYIKKENSMNINFAKKIYALLIKVVNQLRINHEANMVSSIVK